MRHWLIHRKLLLALLILFLVAPASSQSRTEVHAVRAVLRQGKELPHYPTIATSKGISADQRKQLVALIVAEIRPDAEVDGITSQREQRKLALGTRVKLADLNGDGTPEVILQAWDIKAGCGATGNCPAWVFQQDGKNLRKIFDSGSFQRLAVTSETHEGFRDIALIAHESASEQSITFYQFRKGKYKEGRCFDANWMNPSNFSSLKQPTIKPCH
jgi:hypothetical protein